MLAIDHFPLTMDFAMPKQAPAKSAQVSLLVGEDQFSAQAAARERIDRFIPPAEQTLGLEVVDAQADKIDQALTALRRCLEAIRTVGFLGGRKAVWLRGIDFLSHKIIGKNKEVQEMVQALADTIAGGIAERHLLIITALKIDERSSFYKVCVKNGEIAEFNLGDKPWQKDREALTFAIKAFADAGLQISDELTQAFVLKVGTDTRQIMQEINKLSTYLGDRRTVQADDLDAVTSYSRGLFTWDLEDAAGQRDLRRALKVLRQLLFQGEEPMRLIIGLEWCFRNLLIFREALDNRWITVQQTGKEFFRLTTNALPEALAEQFKQALASEKGAPMSPFRAGKLAAQAREFSRREIDQCRAWILAARRQLVSSSVPPKLILEYLILKLCRSPATNR